MSKPFTVGELKLWLETVPDSTMIMRRSYNKFDENILVGSSASIVDMYIEDGYWFETKDPLVHDPSKPQALIFD